MRHRVVARDKPGLLTAMMRALAGDAQVSFEGDLSRCVFPSELVAANDETAILTRQTMRPRQDFVVLRLESRTVQPILDSVLPDGRLMKDIVHVQIQKGGRLQFGSYDNFDPDCIVTYDGISAEQLNALQESGVIRSWQPVPGAGSKQK